MHRALVSWIGTTALRAPEEGAEVGAGPVAQALKESQSRLRQGVPMGMRVAIRRLQEKPGGEGLHNRYVLTDLGGVRFAYGLDEGNTGTTDDLSLLQRDP